MPALWSDSRAGQARQHEWPRHRWADWNDIELDRQGILPEAYDRHRRTPVMHMQWVACDDMKRGHNRATADDTEFGMRQGQCWSCGNLEAPVPSGGVQATEEGSDG